MYVLKISDAQNELDFITKDQKKENQDRIIWSSITNFEHLILIYIIKGTKTHEI